MARAQKYLFYGAYSLTEKVILTMCRKWHDCIGLLYFILWLVQKILTTIFIDRMQKENQLPLTHDFPILKGVECLFLLLLAPFDNFH